MEQMEDIDEAYLERIVQSHLGLPWIMGESERLLIREFCPGRCSIGSLGKWERESDRVFYTPELLQEYIRCQYGFYQCGIWALVEKKWKFSRKSWFDPVG